MEFSVDGVTYKLEPIIWSGLIGALVAFLGSVLSNRNSRRQLRMQHVHDAEQAKRELATALRREVYMEAASWLSYMRQTFARYPAISIENPSPEKGFPAVPIKLQIIGGDSVRTLVQRILIAVSAFLAKHHEERQLLHARDKAIGVLAERIRVADTDGTSVDDYNALVDEHQALRDDLLPRIEKFRRAIAADVMAYSAIATELESAMAQELGFDVDLAARAAAAHTHTLAAFAVIEEVISRQAARRK